MWLPDIARPTHPDQTRPSWVVDAHSLMVASLLLPAALSETLSAGAWSWLPA
jgi:hypothetical protein